MEKVLIDSNILMDLMNGVQAARTEVSYYSDIAISAITWMEVMVGCAMGDNKGQSQQTSRFLTFLSALRVNVIHTDDVIAIRSVEIRAAALAETPKRQIKLPDAIIAATANALGVTIVTRNPRDFGASSVRMPYRCEYEYNEAGQIITWTVSDVVPPL